MKYYKISEIDLRELLTAAHYAWALEGGGVDNWTWEADSRHDYLDEYNRLEGSECETFEEIAEREVNNYTPLPQ